MMLCFDARIVRSARLRRLDYATAPGSLVSSGGALP